jgi:hypothetical protein
MAKKKKQTYSNDEDSKCSKVNEPSIDLYGPPYTFEKVWQMFKETDKIFTKMSQETDKKFQETDKKFQATDKKFQATDKKFQATDKKFQATDKKLNQLENLFVGQWGKLIESLVSGDLVNLLNRRGISVQRLQERSRFKHNNQEGEFDIIALNGTEVVVVEVKTTLRVDDVKHFLAALRLFREVFHEHRDKKVYGAVAFLTACSKSDLYAQRHGLFAIKATGNSAGIINSEDFKPAEF